MQLTAAYIPSDRRFAMSRGVELDTHASGAVLFADLSGFTPLTDALVLQLGAHGAVEAATRLLNHVYNALINEIHRFGGSVIGFSGDAMMCWFGQQIPTGAPRRVDPTYHAFAAAVALQDAMQQFQALQVGPSVTVTLHLKTSIATGPVHRYKVGRSSIQLLDVLTGGAVDRVAAADTVAEAGEIVVDSASADRLAEAVEIAQWRVDENGLRIAQIDPASRTLFEALAKKPALISSDLFTTIQLDQKLVAPWLLRTVFERIQSGQEKYLAELRPAVALFIRFGDLDYDNDPHAGAKLDAYIRWVQTILQRYEGALIQITTGDKGGYLYAAFGAPLAHDDDAERAVAAAHDLRRPPAALKYRPDVQIGLTQGRMRVGPYGADVRRTYGVQGSAVNMASRLMMHAQRGEIIVDAHVADAIKGTYDLDALGKIRVKGREAPVEMYRVVTARALISITQPALYMEPLLGREDELNALHQAAVRAHGEGPGEFVCVVGEAGVGKSHLLSTFVQQIKASGAIVAAGACQSTNQNSAYFSGRQIARWLLGLGPLEHAPPEAQIAHVEQTLAAMNPEWLVRLPVLGDLLGLPIPHNDVTAAYSGRLRRDALINLTVEIVRSISALFPITILLEDIHWIDEASLELMLALARAVESTPILVIGVHRPLTEAGTPLVSALAELTNRTEIRLDSIAPEATAALVERRIGGPVSPLVLDIILHQAQGNPFFTEELVNALKERENLTQVEGRWQLAAPLVRSLRNANCVITRDDELRLIDDAAVAEVALGLPDSIHGIVLSRLDRLPDAAKLTIKVASVIGREFSLDVLAQAHPERRGAHALQEDVTLMAGRDFAKLESSEPDVRYIFKHNVTHEVVYRMLLDDQRKSLHQSVAETIESLHRDDVEPLAFHYFNSELSLEPNRRKCLYYLDRAATRAQREYANETALSYYDRALSLEPRWGWYRRKAEILHILGRREEERLTLQALQTADEVPEYESAYAWSLYLEAISDYSEAVGYATKALAAAIEGGNPEAEAKSHARLGMIAWRQGNYTEAEARYRRTLQIMGDEPRFRDEEAETRYGLGLVFREQGRYDDARSEFDAALRLNRLLGNRQGEARTLNTLGVVAQLRRDHSAALAYYEQALAIRQAIGDRAGVGGSMVSLAQVHSALGDHGHAEPLLRDALHIHQSLKNRWRESLVWNELGITYRLVGRTVEALACLQTSIDLCEAISDESGSAYALCNLGQTLRDLGDTGGAEIALKIALEVAVAQGDAHLEGTCLSELGLTYLRMQRSSQAIELASRSLQKFTELQLELSTAADLGIVALAYLAQDERQAARKFAIQARTILDEVDGDDMDYPQRDYLHCYQVFAALGEAQAAAETLAAACRLLQRLSGAISDEAMRESFLHNVAHNRAILEAAASAGILSDY